MMYIDRVKIEGFGSITDKVKYKFNRAGLNTIVGLNGAGKTTLINALVWCLYQETLKKGQTIEPWPHILDSTYEGTRVRTELHDENHTYEVIRCANYKGKVLGTKGKNRLVVLQDGKPLTLRDKKDYQQWIHKKLGYTYDLFKATVIFGQRLKRLTEEDGPTKKRVFDEAFESVFISKAKDIVAKRMEQHEKLVTDRTHLYEIIKTNLFSKMSEMTRAKEHLKDYQENHGKEVEIVKNELNSLKAELQNKNHPRVIRILRKLQARLDEDAVKKEFDLFLELNSKKMGLERLKDKERDLRIKMGKQSFKCPNCGKGFTASERSKHISGIKAELKQLNLTTLQVEDQIRVIEKKWDKAFKLKTAQGPLRHKINLYNSTHSLCSQLEVKIELKELELKKLEAKKPPTFKIADIRQEIELLRQDKLNVYSQLKEARKILGIDKWLIKDPLSNSGLKAFIFDSMLNKVNNYLRGYKDLIGFGINVYVEMSSARKDIMISITKKGNEVPYQDLSGGQKQLVDVVLAFALNDTVNAMKPINILIMDEVFESLDAENIEVVGNILSRKAKNKAIHIITHQKTFQPVNAYKSTIGLSEKGNTVLEGKYRDN